MVEDEIYSPQETRMLVAVPWGKKKKKSFNAK